MANKITRYSVRLQPVNGVWAQTMIECDDGEFVRYSDVVSPTCEHHWAQSTVHPICGHFYECVICGERKL